jgi:glucose/arabinose dehydrogenase
MNCAVQIGEGRMPVGYLELLRIGFGLLVAGFGAIAAAESLPLRYVDQDLQLPERKVVVQVPAGSRLELLTDRLEGPRLLTFAENGDLFIGSKSGHVYRLPKPYTQPQVLITMKGYPHSVALRQDEILIAQKDGLYHAPYQLGQTQIVPDRLSLLAALPGGSGHSSRTVAIGPDRRIYLSLGISGNCSDQYLSDDYPFTDRRGGILVLNETGAQPSWETFGSGLRNPVGFAWHPVTGKLYASNNGPDHHGYDMPPEYFSQVAAGSFHGMPWFQYNGKQVQRDNCIDRSPPRPISEVTPPVATFPARSAPMGVAFAPAGTLHKSLENDAIVALHGSWATRPSGGFIGDRASRRPPKLVAVRFQKGEVQRVDDLITGFQLRNGERWARPIGVAFGPDGALYFTSDDGVEGLFRLRFPVVESEPKRTE